MAKAELTPDSFMASRKVAAPGSESKGGGQQTEDIITGTLDPDLDATGKRDAKKLSQQTKNIKVVYHGPKKRTKQTADAHKGAKIIEDDALGPWDLGEFEGKPQHEVDKFINDFISKNPTEAVPGGESYDAYKKPLIGLIQKQLAAWKPGERLLDITHSIGVHTIMAWIAAKAPKDRSINVRAMLARKKLKPVALFRINPRNMTMTAVSKSGPDGIYVGRHADTRFDNIKKGGMKKAA